MSRRLDTSAALRRDLATVAARLGADELRVLVLLATRAWVGQTRYGYLDLHRDRRDFNGEPVEELTDATFYSAAALLRRQHSARGPRRPARRRGTPHA